MCHDDVVGREATTAGEHTSEQGQRGSMPDLVYADRLDNAGVDGDTTTGVLARLAGDVLAPRPQLVIVSIGTNDFDNGVPRPQFAKQLQ